MIFFASSFSTARIMAPSKFAWPRIASSFGGFLSSPSPWVIPNLKFILSASWSFSKSNVSL